jgi:hypothetical protein
VSNIFNTICELLQDDLGSANSAYYMVVSKFTPWPDEVNPDPEDGTYKQGDFDFRKEMIFGKKLQPGDVSFLVGKYVWTIDTAYAQYDDDDPELYDKPYYVINSNDDVFKCISNGGGALSTEEPTSKTTDIFELSDGYKWKYMYTLSSANNTKFGTSTFIPIDANTTVEAAAIPGTIDNIVVVSGGANFPAFATGTVLSTANNSNLFRIADNNSGVNNFYNNLMMYVSSGTGDGSMTRIAQHFSNTSGIFVVTTTPLTLDYTSQYIIYPEIVIDGNGDGAKAYCTVNTVSKSIASVNVIDPGAGYTSVNVYANTANADSTLRAVISPVKGHGSDAVSELGSSKFMVITTFDGDESGAIPVELSFREYGMIKDPEYANGHIYTSSFIDSTVSLTLNVLSSSSSYVIGETFTGQTSGAIGILGFANNTNAKGTVYKGSFANGETIVTSNSEIVAQILAINNPQINVYSGDVLFYDTAVSVDRSNSSLEDVGFILSNLSGN